MRLELTRVGLLVELANHYTTRVGGTGEQLFDSCILRKVVDILEKRKEEQEIRERREIIEIIALLNTERVFRCVIQTLMSLLSLRFEKILS